MGLFRKKKDKVYVTLSTSERRMVIYAMTRFRNKCLAANKPTEDIDNLLLRLMK